MIRILTALLIVLACSPAFADGGMQHSLGIYGWFTGLKGTIGVADIAEQPVDATFDDLANYVDFALAGRWEGRSESTIFMADVSYNNLGSERDATVANQPVTAEMDMSQWIMEFGGGWRTMPEFTVLLLGRVYVIDTGATFSGENNENGGNVSTTWADIYLGGRYEKTTLTGSSLATSVGTMPEMRSPGRGISRTAPEILSCSRVVSCMGMVSVMSRKTAISYRSSFALSVSSSRSHRSPDASIRCDWTSCPKRVSETRPTAGGTLIIRGASVQANSPATVWVPAGRRTAGSASRDTTGAGSPSTVTFTGQAPLSPGRGTMVSENITHCWVKFPPLFSTSSSRVVGQVQI